MLKISETNTILTFLRENCTTLNQLKQIHAHLLKFNLPESPSTVAPLLSFAVASHNASFFSYACSIFRNLQYQSTFIYNTMIRGYAQSHLPVPAILCYKTMLKDRLIVNNYTFTPLLKACSMLSNEKMGVLVHAHVVKLGFLQDPFIVSSLIEFYSSNLDMISAAKLFDEISQRDVVLWTAMIDGYGKVGEIEKARNLFDEMPERNVISWSAIMVAYSRASEFKEVLLLCRRMEEAGVKPNESVLVSVLTACAHLGALAQGLWIHSYARRLGFESNRILATALVDMYSKCGCIELALSVFEGISNKDSEAWNAIISGMAMNGYATKSLELFDEMVSVGTQPTDATFVSILSACTHANMVQKGLLLFKNMSSVYLIEPKVEHYACVVDLLARAGKLEEAEKFIQEKMGGGIGEGDVNVWGALLGACRTYGNTEMGDRIWRKLASRGVKGYGNHVLSYNLYREAGWEKEAKRVRRFIESTGMKKKPGCSSIEVNGIVEEFIAGNVSYPKGQQICQVLDSLVNVMFLTH
ncbi:hypothetical protein M9H77_24573 [Catharanthus roseus]|uniref:Uncharacterized protein n=1 Tax=Catharanthus roseus TaxID=4058 RepID=A0ACC0AY19_CATRO|nr:hypothetical protein M9H77_24573 [Catharanthus roseus]